MEKEPNIPSQPENPEEDIKVIDGKKCRRVNSGYTIRQYYSHSTPEKGPGPGWDFRKSLLDDNYAMEQFGRTFTEKEVYGPDQLPDDPFYNWEPIEEK